MSRSLASNVLLFGMLLLCIGALVLFLSLLKPIDSAQNPSSAPSRNQRQTATPYVTFEHHTNAQIKRLLEQYGDHYPDLSRVYSLGQSGRGTEMMAIEISDLPGIHEPGEPEVKLVANIHGNEVVGREVMLHLMDYLLKNYHTNSTVQSIVNSVRLHIVPTMNPDGYDDSQVGECVGVQGRGNAKNKDLNRNFPDRFDENNIGKEFQPETINVMKWTKSFPFVLSAAFHGGALVVNYPYDNNRRMQYGYTASPDDKVFKHLSLSYSMAHPVMNKGKCSDKCHEQEDYFENGITNGAQWYPLSGGMQDWNYIHADCFELTIEMGCKKYPQADRLQQYWNDNLNSILQLINSVHIGVKGFVKDTQGLPLQNAVISVDGIDKNVTSKYLGDYWRLLVPSLGRKYRVTASKEGYISETRHVAVSDSLEPQSICRARLLAISTNVTQKSGFLQNWRSYPVDFTDNFEINTKDDCNIPIRCFKELDKQLANWNLQTDRQTPRTAVQVSPAPTIRPLIRKWKAFLCNEMRNFDGYVRIEKIYHCTDAVQEISSMQMAILDKPKNNITLPLKCP